MPSLLLLAMHSTFSFSQKNQTSGKCRDAPESIFKKIVKCIKEIFKCVQCISSVTFHLWGSKAEGSGVNISLFSINQVQPFVLSETQVPTSRHVAESEWLAPAYVPPTPANKYEKKFKIGFLEIIFQV